MQLKIKSWLKVIITISALSSTATQAAPEFEGRWSPVVDWPIVAIHSVLTPQGNVMNFGTDKNGMQGARFFYDVWDPSKGSGANSHNTLPNTLGVDSFCSAAILMPQNGNILMAGGDTRPYGTPNNGINDAPIFNPRSNTLSRAPQMSYARWYPTATVLSNGEILVVGGKDGSGRPVTTPEVYSPNTNKWRSLFGLSTAGFPDRYPRQWVAPDGRIFGIFDDKTMYYFNLGGNGSTQILSKLPVSGSVFQSSSVMYRNGKILHVGGTGSSTNDTVIINIEGSNPQIRAVSKPQEAGRSWVDSVVLPNGKVMIVGGSQVDNELNGASYRPEIWDPNTERWSLMASAEKARLYHSTALLLKDGRVLVAGGGTPGPQTNTNAEIFSPPYLFSNGALAPRPSIVSAVSDASYGSKVSVQFRSNEKISRVTLVKTGAVTHSFNMEQRFLEPSFTDTASGITVSIPWSSNVATPGYYLMYLINNKGVPSEGHIIRISSEVTNPGSAFPVASNDTVTTPINTPITIEALANDTGFNLAIVEPNAWSLKGGEVSLVNNRITYKPKQGFVGTDKIWYVLRDGQGRTNSGEVTINVSAGGQNGVFPSAKLDVVHTVSGIDFTIDALANDSGSGLILEAPNVWSLKGGKVSLANNKIVYKSKQGFTGVDKIWYLFRDNQGRKNSGEVNITVYGSGPEQYPIAITDWFKTGINTTRTVNVLANDIGTGMVINDVNRYSVNGATLDIVNNQLRYTPNINFTGEDSFWYALKDNQGRTNSVAVTVYVGN